MATGKKETKLTQETGLEFLLRMKEEFTFRSEKFGGFSTNDFILLTTPCSNSKALHITQLLSQIILPQKHEGMEQRVLLLDLDYGLHMLNLLGCMERKLKTLKLTSTVCDKAMSSSPSMLKVIRCSNTTELYVTLSSIRELVLNESISILVCDCPSLYNMDNKTINFMYSTLHSLPKASSVAVVFACYVLPEMSAIKFPKPADIVWSIKRGESGKLMLTVRRNGANLASS